MINGFNEAYVYFNEAYDTWNVVTKNKNNNPGVMYVQNNKRYNLINNIIDDKLNANPVEELIKYIKLLYSKGKIKDIVNFYNSGVLYVSGDLSSEILKYITKFKTVAYYSDIESSIYESDYPDTKFIRYNKIFGDIDFHKNWWTHDFYNKAYEKFNNGKRKMPVLIPSYNRPDNVTTKTIFNEMTNECNWDVYLVVRNSQLEEYKKHNEKFNYVKFLSFPDEEINNLGAVRRTIVDWLYANNYEFGFMFDDDITELTYTFRGYTEKGDLKAKYLHRKGVDIPKVIAMWQLSMEYGIKNFDLVASSISPMFSSWKFDYTNQEQSLCLYRGVPSQVMCINAKKFKENNLIYPDTNECGHEDIDMAIKIIDKGLNIGMFTFLVYSACPMSVEFGNIANTMQERMRIQQEIMKKNHLGKSYVRFQDKRDLAQVSINWIEARKRNNINKFRFNLWNNGGMLN